MLPLALRRRYQLDTQFRASPALKSVLGSAKGLRFHLPEIPLAILTRYGVNKSHRFFFDTGADHMIIPIYMARHEGIPFREDFPGTLTSSVGGRVRCFLDYVHIKSSLSGKTHRWICAFAESVQTRLIVGRSGFLDDFTATITDKELIVSYRVSLSRFVSHHAGRFRAPAADPWEPI